MRAPTQDRELDACSLGELVSLAHREALIDGFEEGDRQIVLLQGSTRLLLSPQRARVFLIGMLRGRSAYLAASPASPEPSAPDRHAGEPAGRGIEAPLDALLAYAHEVGIIRHFEKDPGSHTASIQIAACTSRMGYDEAVSFLFDCVQEYARTLPAYAVR